MLRVFLLLPPYSATAPYAARSAARAQQRLANPNSSNASSCVLTARGRVVGEARFQRNIRMDSLAAQWVEIERRLRHQQPMLAKIHLVEIARR